MVDETEQEPEFWLTYPGDIRSSISPTHPIGQRKGNELMWPVVAEYDSKTNKTRVGISLKVPTHLFDMSTTEPTIELTSNPGEEAE